ncbi:tetratricopeptide repeat protein [Pararhizobium sp. IMCC21322]|uniref:tetratricopeptide repeat protein n=1 Tax=Pararhizobium sp. IMCC21322 TaxID=3067903 RepID=UPI0027413071|nr:tetratricopeptide repeat protein [Pararhizobium sp. IMCC21322]
MAKQTTPVKFSKSRHALSDRTLKHIKVLAAALLVGGFSAAFQAPSFADEDAEPLRFARGFSGNFLAAQIAGGDNDTLAAVQFFERALSRDPGNPVLIQQAFFLHLINGSVEEAVPFAKDILQFDASNDLARTVLGVTALKKGNFGQAAGQFDKASGQAPLELLTNQLLAAWSEAGKEDLAASIARIDKLEGPDWYESFRSFHAGLIAAHLGDQEQAFARVARAYEYDQSALRIVEGFARLQALKGSPEKGLAAIRAFKQQVPRHPYMDRVEADINDGKRVELAGSSLKGAAEVLFGLGSALGRDGGSELPKIYLQLSLYLNPQSDLAIMALVDVYNDDEQYALAVDLVDGLPEESVFADAANIEAARNLARLEKVDEAIKRLTNIARETDDPFPANLALANVLRFEKRFEEANAIYNIIIDGVDAPERRHWSLFYSRAITYERTDQWDAAEDDFRKALELFPDQPLVLNYLGYSFVDKGINLDEALGMIEKAVEQRPEEGFILDSLGWAYFKLGRYGEAVVQLEKATEKMAADPLVHDHLGDAYWRAGRTLEAQFQWAHARDLEPENPDDLAKIEDKLENGLPPEAARKVAAKQTDTVIDQANDEGKARRTHIVADGESLWDIAKSLLGDGDAYLDILELNRDRLPESGPLVVGTELHIPDRK